MLRQQRKLSLQPEPDNAVKERTGFRIVQKSACLLQLGGAGSGAGGEKAFMCKVNGGSVKEGYQVTVYPNGREDSSVTYGGVLYLPDLALDADLPSGAWLIGHKCALKATGGEDK